MFEGLGNHVSPTIFDIEELKERLLSIRYFDWMPNGVKKNDEISLKSNGKMKAKDSNGTWKVINYTTVIINYGAIDHTFKFNLDTYEALSYAKNPQIRIRPSKNKGLSARFSNNASL